MGVYSTCRSLVKDTTALSSRSNPFKDAKMRRLIPTILIILVNIGIVFFIGLKQKAGVSRYLLVILMVNMMLYINYYIGHKLYYRLRCKNWHKSEGFRPIA